MPYNHANVDSDEVLFYVGGDFMSRKGSGIGLGSISLHPAGFIHGPQPGSVEAAIGKPGTDEVAVMVDTFRPLGLGADGPGGGGPGVRLDLGPGPRPVNLGLLAGLVDDAGLFPPEQLPMAAALARHRADEAAGHPMLTHRFLCPASRLGELRAELGRLGRRWRAGQARGHRRHRGGRAGGPAEAGGGSGAGARDARGAGAVGRGGVDGVGRPGGLRAGRLRRRAPRSGLDQAAARAGPARRAAGCQGPLRRRPGGALPVAGGAGGVRLRLRRARRPVQGDGRAPRRRPPHRRAHRLRPSRLPQPGGGGGAGGVGAPVGEVAAALASTDGPALAGEARAVSAPGGGRRPVAVPGLRLVQHQRTPRGGGRPRPARRLRPAGAPGA